MNKHAFLFDVDDTLYDQLEPFTSAYNNVESIHGKLPVEELYKSFRRHSDEVFHKTENGEMSLNDMYIYRISQAFKEFGVIITNEEALDFQHRYVMFQKKIELLPDIIQTLDYCRENAISMGIITNGPTEHQKNKIKQLGLYKWIRPENIFISAEVGFSKPDPRIFILAEKTMGLKPKETYFIGDSFPNDVIGAKNAGWKAIWYNRREHSLPDSKYLPDFIHNNGDSLTDLVKGIL